MNLDWFAGPCSVETAEQMRLVLERMGSLGVPLIRGGVFKMRTSPDSFQGLRHEGIELIRQLKQEKPFQFVTEVSVPEQIDLMEDIADVYQVGSRSMYSYELLKALAESNKPVVLKRAFSATLSEWLKAGEYLLKNDSDKTVWFCERGVRGFDDYFRNTLDVNAIAYINQKTPFVAMVDASHATGRSDFVEAGTLSGVAAGAKAVMVEVHPKPASAMSDADQALCLDKFEVIKRKADALYEHLQKS